jgi:hypothetical protein
MAFTSDNPLQSNQVPISNDFPQYGGPDFFYVLEQCYKRMVSSLNTKEGAFYLLLEQATFKQLYTAGNTLQNRNVYRKVFDVVAQNGGPIGPSATVTFAHNISSLTNSMLIYGSCTSNVPEFFTVVYPYVKLNATNVVFTNPTTDTLTQAIVIAEYTKN